MLITVDRNGTSVASWWWSRGGISPSPLPTNIESILHTQYVVVGFKPRASVAVPVKVICLFLEDSIHFLSVFKFTVRILLSCVSMFVVYDDWAALSSPAWGVVFLQHPIAVT